MGAKLSIIYFLIGVARVTNLLHFKRAYKNGASEWVIFGIRAKSFTPVNSCRPHPQCLAFC